MEGRRGRLYCSIPHSINYNTHTRANERTSASGERTFGGKLSVNYKYKHNTLSSGEWRFPSMERETAGGRLEIVQKRRERKRERLLQLLLFFSIQFHGGSVSLLPFASSAAAAAPRRMMTLLLFELKKTRPLSPPSIRLLAALRSQNDGWNEK